MKMYILIRKKITRGFATVAAAHAAVKCYMEFRDHPNMVWWAALHYKKCTVQVTDAQFEKAKSLDEHIVWRENDCDYEEQAIAFCPREDEDWPRWMTKLPLHP